MPLSSSSVSFTGLSTHQTEIYTKLQSVVTAIGLDVIIDPRLNSVLNRPLALDVEHDENGGFVGVGVYDGEHVYYFTSPDRLQWLVGVPIIAHNGKTDFECLRSWGIPVADGQLIWDVMLMGHIIDSSLKSYGLKDMAKRELGIEYPDYSEIVGKDGKHSTKITLDKQPLSIVALYNALDCYVTYKLYEKQDQRIDLTSIRYQDIVEKPASLVFQAMETRGIRIDVPYLQDLQNELEALQKPIKEAILTELGDINLNSPKQLLGALNAKQIQPTLKNKPSTDKRALKSLSSIPVVKGLLDYSELETLLSSFVRPYLGRQTEVVHPFFNQCGTRTGRPSCSNPNLLQIPKRTENGKRVRRMFIAREGMQLGDCDFGQIEPRVLAHFSKDPNLCGMFKHGIDFHTFTSEKLGISRDRAKILNLSVGYRATYKSVAEQLGGTNEEAQAEIDKWWALFPTLRRWQDTLIYNAQKSGFCTTLLGRRIKVDGLTDGNKWKKEAAERQLINNITQASAAEIMKLAMIKIYNDERLTKSFGLLIQVYDQLIAESYNMEDDIKIMIEDMETAISLEVPLTVDAKIGPNWAEVK